MIKTISPISLNCLSTVELKIAIHLIQSHAKEYYTD